MADGDEERILNVFQKMRNDGILSNEAINRTIQQLMEGVAPDNYLYKNSITVHDISNLFDRIEKAWIEQYASNEELTKQFKYYERISPGSYELITKPFKEGHDKNWESWSQLVILEQVLIALLYQAFQTYYKAYDESLLRSSKKQGSEAAKEIEYGLLDLELKRLEKIGVKPDAIVQRIIDTTKENIYKDEGKREKLEDVGVEDKRAKIKAAILEYMKNNPDKYGPTYSVVHSTVGWYNTKKILTKWVAENGELKKKNIEGYNGKWSERYRIGNSEPQPAPIKSKVKVTKPPVTPEMEEVVEQDEPEGEGEVSVSETQ